MIETMAMDLLLKYGLAGLFCLLCFLYAKNERKDRIEIALALKKVQDGRLGDYKELAETFNKSLGKLNEVLDGIVIKITEMKGEIKLVKSKLKVE